MGYTWETVASSFHVTPSHMIHQSVGGEQGYNISQVGWWVLENGLSVPTRRSFLAFDVSSSTLVHVPTGHQPLIENRHARCQTDARELGIMGATTDDALFEGGYGQKAGTW